MSIKNNANLIMEMNGTINRFSYLFSHTRALIALFSLTFFTNLMPLMYHQAIILFPS